VATEDLGKLLRAIGFNPQPEEIVDMQEDIHSPTFTFKTFVYLVFRHGREVDPATELIDAFRVLDKTGSGRLKVSEIRHILKNIKEPLSDGQVEELIRRAEPVRDEIDYVSFVQIMLDY
jgi:Ca2+-binding EF-hand superfamily protein